MAAPPQLTISSLFDLARAGHGELFAGAELPWELLDRLPDYLARLPATGIEGTVADGAWLVGDGIRIAAGAIVEPGAYIEGPCVIGPGSQVRHGAYIRGNVLVGADCVVGHATEVKGSIFLDGAKAGHFAYVGDSILGVDVNLGAGTKLANLRLDRSTVRVRIGGQVFDTGRRKLGAILGDGVETGCNSVTNPGTVLGPRCRIHPCTSIGGYHPAERTVASRGR